MPSGHATLNPSAAQRWLNCSPSARLNAKLTDRFGETSSPYAEEGTKAHSLSEIKIRHESGAVNDYLFKTLRDELGDIPKDMDMFTDRYVDEVLERYYAARRTCPDAELLVEQRFTMDRWVPHCFGTSDAVIVSDDVLFVIDLKYGKGVPVSAEENPQARLYGLGGIEAYGALYGFDSVHTMIVQPRLDSVSEEVLSRDELLAWGESIKPVAEQAWRGEGEFKTGSWCRFCTARAICAKRASEAMDVFKYGFDAPSVIPDSDVPGILKVLDTAEDWIKDIRAYALAQAKQGVEYRGWKLVRGRRPGRKWKNEEEVVNELARAGYGRDQYEETKLKSASEMEKVLGKSAFDALLGKLVSQADGPLTLVPADDKRPEFSPADAVLQELLEEN